MEIPFLGNLCAPALVYLILSVIVTAFEYTIHFNIVIILINILFIGLWTFVLNWICSTGYSIISWVMIIVPIIIAVFLGI